MSIFNSIRKSRQQAKDHMSKLAEQKKKEDEKEPYRHVPTHAASDAFAAAPPAWRETNDRPRIIEQNRRRSAMAASGHHMNMPSVPRVGSSLSYMSYPGGPGAYSAAAASSSSAGAMMASSSGRMRVPRSYSAAGISPYPDGSRDIIYSIPDVAYSEPASLKDYTPKDYSPPSQDGSSSSQDDLEMPKTSRPPVASSNGRPVSKTHRLHPSSRSRRTSDASVDRGGAAPAAAATSAGARQESWHPQRVSSLGYAPLQVGVAPKPLDASAIAPEPSNTRANAHEDALRALESRQTPAPKPGPLRSSGPTHADAGTSARTARFTELDPADSRAPAQEIEEPAPAAATPPAPAPQPIVNSFPEPASESRDPSPPPPKSKSKKLTKGGGKLLKKNR